MENNYENWNLQNSYLELPDCFYERIEPTLVQNPKIVNFEKLRPYIKSSYKP